MMNCNDETEQFITLISGVKDGETIRRKVRKQWVCSESNYLKRKLEDCPNATEIKIPLKDPGNLHTILSYIYERQLVVSNDNIETLWNDAKILGLGSLQDACVQRMMNDITDGNWVRRFKFSIAHGLGDLLGVKTLEHVNANYAKCVRDPNFKWLNAQEAITILRTPAARQVLESSKIRCIIEWVKHNHQDRWPEAFKLLKEIDLVCLDEDLLQRYLEDVPIFRNLECVTLLEDAIRRKNVDNSDTDSTISAISIHSDLDDQVDATLALSEDPPSTSRQSNNPAANVAVVLEDVAIAGKSSRKRVTFKDLPIATAPAPRMRLKRINPEELTPSKRLKSPASPKSQDLLKSIIYSRNNSAGRSLVTTSVHFGNKRTITDNPVLQSELLWDQELGRIYRIGGLKTPKKCTNLVSYYSSLDLNWPAYPAMKTARSRFKAVLLGRGIFVFGGVVDYSRRFWHLTNKCEVLDLATMNAESEWVQIPPMIYKREQHAAVVVDGKIYIFGGHGDQVYEIEKRALESWPLRSMECYNPATNRWTELKGMKRHRWGHAAVVLNSKIYALGGSGQDVKNKANNIHNMRSAEVYDVKANRWTPIAPMIRPRMNGSAVAMNGKVYVIGGDEQSLKAKAPPSVEVYDPENDEWSFLTETADEAGDFRSCIFLDNPRDALPAPRMIMPLCSKRN